MATEPSIEIIANALALAARQQGVDRVLDLDFEQLAAAAIEVTRASPAPANPLDPEGDGLTPREINAANDG